MAERDAMRAQMGLGPPPSYNPLSIRADRPSGAADDGAADASAVSEEKHLELIEAAELLEAALEASTKREAELMRRLELEERRAPPRGGYGASGGRARMRRSSARRRTRTRRPGGARCGSV